MANLRGVIRTMYPPILADRGLSGALAALGARAPVPTEIDVSDLGDPPAAIQAAAYFVVAESLTNAVKHSGATGIRVRLWRTDDRLTAEVVDDGAGGADPAGGTGITGMRGRVAALDGRFEIRSPAGGPTVVTAVLPCGS